ncbi:MAG: hypothetical protein E7I11_12860 [Klebsiella michiganensis]|nr:hypothetical protein [Klebsiella michiganensis]
MMNPVPWLQMTNMISYQGLVRTFLKLHDSTIIALEDIIRVANIPEEQRKGLISKLRELPADAIKHLTLQLLTPAVLHPQAVIQSIEKFLQTL